MKKKFTLGLALLFAISGTSSIALADGVENIESEEIIEDETLDLDEELELLDSISLETALEFALEDNFSLLLLNYQQELMDAQVAGATKNYGETAFDIKDLERTKDRLQRASGSFSDRFAVQNQLEALEKQIRVVEDILEQVKSGKVTLTYSAEEAKESIKMATIATYTQLLMSKEQQNLQEKALETKEKEVAMMKRQYDLGVISRHDHATELREIERQKAQIEVAEKAWNEDLAEFALDLGIIYHSNLFLQPLDLSDLKLLEQETETEKIIEGSFKYKGQVEAITLAEFQREQVYDDKDSDKNDKDQADLSVKIAKENLEKLKIDAEASIRRIYSDMEDGYRAIQDAERELRFAREDYQTLKKRYELGIVSKVNYELASIAVDRAELTRDLTKETYFLLTKQIELLEAGILQ